MGSFSSLSVSQYLDQLAAHKSVPGGGSAAALTAASGAALISMVAHYSVGKGQPKAIDRKIETIQKKAEKIRLRLTELIDLDAEVYLGVVAARKQGEVVYKQALKKAQKVPVEICKLSYQAVELLPFLVEKGNRFLLSDVQVAAELLMAGFNSAQVMVEVNAA